jgi:hypothetical protein
MKSSKSLDLNLDSLIANLRQGAEDFCNSRAVVNLSSRDYESAAEEIERLREERDEARRELCIGLADHTHLKFTLPDGCWNQLKVEHARGWDCFKEPTE